MADPQHTAYTLHFLNESRNPWTFCVYLQQPDVNVPGAQALAWLTVKASPTTRVMLTWTLDYGFAWTQSGTLANGNIQLAASQVWPADLNGKNRVTFTTKHDLPTFAAVDEGPNSGSLYIHQDRRVRANRSMVGIALSGLPAWVVPAQPNVDVIFTPRPEYWVTFGQFVQGESIDLSEVTSAAPVVFPPNCFTMVARLAEDNLWRVGPLDAP